MTLLGRFTGQVNMSVFAAAKLIQMIVIWVTD